MVFCNQQLFLFRVSSYKRHNPYFNRWFSAIEYAESIGFELVGHNPYFNRWFSAIIVTAQNVRCHHRHNPYFNRWFSAIICYQKKI